MGINKDKIAVICNYELLPERVGGMDYFFWEFDKKCKENNIHIDWFFPNNSNHGNYSDLTIHSSKTENVENNFLTFCEKNKTEYSHVFTHFIELCTPFFYKIKKSSNAKIIGVDHNPRPLNGYSFKKKVKKKLKGILFSRYIDVFVGVSEYSKNELTKDFGSQIKSKVIVIPNGLDFSKFKKKTNFSLRKKFIVVSHLRKEKGIQDLIVAVKDIDENQKKDISIDIYGKGYYKEELNRMIEDFSLQNIFNFKGSVSNINEIYCNYDYLIHPSHGETFCYVVVESLISGLPVITTKNEGNVLGIIEDRKSGFLFEVTKIDQLKKILENVLNGNYILENNSNINDNLQAFSLTQMVDNYLGLVSENKFTKIL